MKNTVIILTSDYTGHGHKSITESLCEELSKDSNTEVIVVDGFALAGNFGLRVGKLYGSITRKSKRLWKVIWDVSKNNPKAINKITKPLIRSKLIRLLHKVKPDVIISVHANFVGPVLDILEKQKMPIPFITLLADLVSISPLWLDKRADYVICPSEDTKQICLQYGYRESQLKVFKLPVRNRFVSHNIAYSGRTLKQGQVPTFLVMSGGEGVGDMGSQAETLLENFDCNVKVLAGRNVRLKSELENTLCVKYPNRLEVYAFTEQVQDLMLTSNIALTRGSPNVIMEAVNCALPLIVFDALPGQEEGNLQYVEKNNIGMVCKGLSQLKPIVNDLLSDNASKLNKLVASQISFRDPDNTQKIAHFILDVCKNR